MKTKITISAMLGLLTFAFIYGSSTNESTQAPVSAPTGNQFLIGAMTAGWQTNYSKLTDTLGFNMWHRYLNGGAYNGQFYIHGWTPSDELDSPIDDYRTDIQGIISDNNTYGMRTLMERPKIERLAYGERSDYQCEATYLNEDLLFYAYSNHPAGSDDYDNDPNYGSNSWVRYCTNPTNDPNARGWVVTGLKANREQVNMDGRWEGDRSYGWIVKPSIRADKNFVNDPANYNTPICRIDVLNYDGDLIKSTDIRARNFRPGRFQDYDGKYKEEFNFDAPSGDSTLTFQYWQAVNFNPIQPNGKYRDWFVPDGTCHVDFKVYWYGACDMWIDYVRVDNDVANDLLSTDTTNQTHRLYDNWLQWEATDIAQHTSSPYKFYIEEFEFNNIPCMSYVSRKLRSYNPNIGLMCDLNYSNYNTMIPFPDWDHIPNVKVDHVKRYLIDSVGSSEIFMGAYPLAGFPPDGSFGQYSWSKIPNTLPCGPQSYDADIGMLAYSVTPAQYDDWLQNQFDETTVPYWSYRLWAARADSISKLAEIPFINIFQAHLWWGLGHRLKEPTNEEMEMMSNLALSYGARGILYFWYEGFGNLPRTVRDAVYARGLTNPLQTDLPNTFELPERPSGVTYDARTQNVYGQNKWQKIIDINTHLKALGPTLMSFNNADRHSYIYYNQAERGTLLTTSYFADVVSYFPFNGPIEDCQEDYPGIASPTGMQYDCKNARYLQVATFKKTGDDINKYFMIVNRRCSPYLDESTVERNGGRRLIKIRFSNYRGDFNYVNNWNVYDATNPTQVLGEFTRNGNEFVTLGDKFMPGEGRLFVIKPVLRSGGILIADEVIENANFTCEDTVWNNGYNITFKGNGNTISFTDSATIVMNGGTFQTDSASHGPQTNKNTFQAVSGNKWSGLHFNHTNVKIYNSQFQDISSPIGGNYAVNCIDCPLNDIRYSTFISSSDTAGGVNAAYTTPFATTDYYTYIMNNTFTMNNSRSRAVQVQSYAGLTMSAYVENNSMSSNGYATGILASTVTGGVIKNNTISGFATGINMLLSSCDLYGNAITNATGEGKGITAAGLSYINMAPTSSGEWTGGMNSITNAGNGSINLDIDNSAFCMLNGYNIFDIDTSKTSSPFHINGSFWQGDYSYSIRGEANCFKLSGNVLSLPDMPSVFVTDYNDNQVYMDFPQYTCDGTPPANYDLADIGNGLYDTIPNVNGQGGGHSSISSPKTIYDSIRVQLRHRNYSVVKNLCYELINAYPDSGASITSLQTLYMASIATDTSQTSFSNLRSFYENLILNHGSNGAMVKISNYLVQKCKVLLRQYSSALAGFQQIINNNQYNYEGLLARWDYMATSLLMNGQGGGESISDFGIEIADLNTEPEFDEPDGDKSPFTKEQKVAIRKSVINTLEGAKRTDEQKINILKERQKNGDVTANIELRQKTALKNIIKTERPKNIFEHLKIVNGDIQKIFGNHEPLKKDPKNQLPMVYNLYQNFPNPFNPSTKINFDLPKDSKVTLIIYDILGRVVKRLINSEFKQAGRYSIDFNGINYASGVYFYRIEANDFVMSKKMVLVK